VRPLKRLWYRFRLWASLPVCAFGCASGPGVEYSQTEAQCLDKERARLILLYSACGENTEGICSTDSLKTETMKRRLACLER
jgi:hypothetical protein